MTTQPQITLPPIGAPWPEQGGIFIGVCPGQNDQPDYCLIAPTDPRALLIDVQWHDKYVEIAGADSDWDGMANTLAMVEGGSSLASQIRDLEIDGRRDLYLPARHETRLIKLVAPQLIVDGWHWTSTQSSADYAYVQHFASGGQGSGYKDGQYRARLVRRFISPLSI